MTTEKNDPDERKRVARYADPAMFTATPIEQEDGGLIKPHVDIVSMTSDPLRVVAAVNEMYSGHPVAHPEEMTKQQALTALERVSGHALEAPLEWVHIAMLITGVSRAFTHQLVRQRTAVYAQESLRFAVKENAAMEVVLPPTLEVLAEDDPLRRLWSDHVARTGWVYNAMVDAGLPAEDARGLLPTNIGTRIHYDTDLRNLAEHSGLRLTSQAQHEWKLVWAEIVRAILAYGPKSERWQQQAIVRLFKPICFQTGRCMFNSPTDRWCVIRDRVEAHHAAGDPPSTWTDIDPMAPLHYLAARDPYA